MLPTTLDAMRAMLRADPSISPDDRNRLLSLMRQGPVPVTQTPAVVPTGPRFMRRQEVAKCLSVSLRTVDKYAAMGTLHKRTLPGRSRASGFLAADVEALIQGKVTR